ncbi:MAG TPA: helix-turn-helix domain-containing protein [Micromonosporaceae bacterium]|nr:helix-turn-helix domain-containing protein [Micromonosporaceae bacterium]
MAWVFTHSRSKNAERLVMLAVADACNSRDGTGAWLSYAALCAKTNLSERAAHAAVQGCERRGELRVERTAGRGGVNRYAVIMLPVDNPVDGPTKGADSADIQERAQNLRPAESADIRTDDVPQVSPLKGAESAGQRRARKGAESADGTVKTSSTKKSGSKKHPDSDTPDREDVEAVCGHLVDWIVRNGSKRPKINQEWRDEARRLIDLDGRTVEQIIKAIDWCQQDPFWRANILSMRTLRRQYDQLRLAAQRKNSTTSPMNGPYRNHEDPQAHQRSWDRRRSEQRQ